MRMKFTFKSLLLACALLVGSVNAWAEAGDLTVPFDRTWTVDDYGTESYAPFNAGYIDKSDGNAVGIRANRNETSTAWFSNEDEERSTYVLQDNETVTISFKAFHGWGSSNNGNTTNGTVAILNSDGITLAGYTYASISNSVTDVVLGGQTATSFNGFACQSYYSDQYSVNGFDSGSRGQYYLTDDSYNPTITITISKSGYVTFNLVLVKKNIEVNYSAQLDDITIDLQKITLSFEDARTGQERRALAINNLSITSEISETPTALYTVKYVDEEGNAIEEKDDAKRMGNVGDKVNAQDIDKETFYSNDGAYKYVYDKADEDVEITADGEAVIKITFKKYGKYTAIVNAKNDGTTLTSFTGEAYEDEDAKISISKYIKVDGVWYVTNETSFVATLTKDNISKDVTYEKSDIYYFVEAENLTSTTTTYGGFIENIANDVSGGKEVRHIGNSYWYTEPIEDAGVYTVSFPARYGSSKSASIIDLKLRDAQGELTDLGITVTLNEENSKTLYSYNIAIPAGSSFVLNKGEGNSNYYIDYITFARIDNVSVTISPAGYSTFSSEYAVEIPEGLTAYIATTSEIDETSHEGTITFEEVTGTVAANTGLLLRSNADESYELPAAIEGTDYSGKNILKAVSGTVAKGNYIFAYNNNDETDYGFYYVDSETGVNVGTGKAYIAIDSENDETVEIKTFRLVFGGGTATAIEAVESADAEADCVIYNVAGQQVGKDYKGIVIKNGKKYLNK